MENPCLVGAKVCYFKGSSRVGRWDFFDDIVLGDLQESK
jgi:hypothetical protein